MLLAPVFTHSPEEGVRLVTLVALVPLANGQQLIANFVLCVATFRRLTRLNDVRRSSGPLVRAEYSYTLNSF